jgi:hypothetical protein
MSSPTYQSRFLNTTIFTFITVLFLSVFSHDVLASPDTKNQLNNLLSGNQHVLMMRHADAPGYSDPAGFNVKDCSSQRNLGETG